MKHLVYKLDRTLSDREKGWLLSSLGGIHALTTKNSRSFFTIEEGAVWMVLSEAESARPSGVPGVSIVYASFCDGYFDAERAGLI